MLLKCLVFIIRSATFLVIAWHAIMPEAAPKAAERAQTPDPSEEFGGPQA